MSLKYHLLETIDFCGESEKNKKIGAVVVEKNLWQTYFFTFKTYLFWNVKPQINFFFFRKICFFYLQPFIFSWPEGWFIVFIEYRGEKWIGKTPLFNSATGSWFSYKNQWWYILLGQKNGFLAFHKPAHGWKKRTVQYRRIWEDLSCTEDQFEHFVSWQDWYYHYNLCNVLIKS